MSKEPEVGDVWEVIYSYWDDHHVTFKAIVVNTTRYIHPYCLTETGDQLFMVPGEAEFKYLGKSKTDIKCLFEVEK